MVRSQRFNLSASRACQRKETGSSVPLKHYAWITLLIQRLYKSDCYLRIKNNGTKSLGFCAFSHAYCSKARKTTALDLGTMRSREVTVVHTFAKCLFKSSRSWFAGPKNVKTCSSSSRNALMLFSLEDMVFRVLY